MVNGWRLCKLHIRRSPFFEVLPVQCRLGPPKNSTSNLSSHDLWPNATASSPLFSAYSSPAAMVVSIRWRESQVLKFWLVNRAKLLNIVAIAMATSAGLTTEGKSPGGNNSWVLISGVDFAEGISRNSGMRWFSSREGFLINFVWIRRVPTSVSVGMSECFGKWVWVSMSSDLWCLRPHECEFLRNRFKMLDEYEWEWVVPLVCE